MESCYATTAQSFFHFTPASFPPSPPSSAALFLKSHFRKINQSPLAHRSRQFSHLSGSRSLSHVVAFAAPAAAENTVSDKLPADIIVTETPEPDSRVRLSVEVPTVVCDDCYKRVMKEFMKQAKIPGFRPGKNVPESILISYVGKETVKRATIESILKRTLPHALSSILSCTGKAEALTYSHRPYENKPASLNMDAD